MNNAELLDILKSRFDKNPERHSGLQWQEIQSRLEKKPEKLAVLAEMEKTGGEPDVTGYDKKSGEYLFIEKHPAGYERRTISESSGGLFSATGAMIMFSTTTTERNPITDPGDSGVF